MAIIKPFPGLRPRPELAARVAAPPYDVLSAKEARVLADGNPYSFLRVNKAELEFPDTVNPYSDEVYQRAADNLKKLEQQGTLVTDPTPCLYLYRLTMRGRPQTGLVALTSVEEYDRGIIKRHEHTRPEKVTDRANHIIRTSAQVGPVFTAFHQQPAISRLFDRVMQAPPTIDFVADDQIRHELWPIADARLIAEFVAAFAALPYLYIADGHHRSEAASQVALHFRERNPHHRGDEPHNYFLNVLFADTELQILPYNRVVRDMNGLTPTDLLGKLGTTFDISPSGAMVTPDQPRQFGLYCDRRWYRLAARPGTFETAHPTRSLDSAILSELVLGPILGITNLRTDHRIDFVGGIRGTGELARLVDSGEYQLAFSLYPTTIHQLMTVADAGDVMPPKSTWFEPKLRDGMVVYRLPN